jgi:Rad3-related DNA helicase
LGGSPEDYTVRFPSPFKKENLFLAVADDVSTKYTQRDRSIGDIVKYIKAVAEGRPGNYLVFFPSYKYMNSVYEQFSSLYPKIEVIIQQPFMKESEKEQFLQYFVQTSGKMLIGFAVMGGMFSEGIDLAGDRLLGVIVVGVGLPQVCFERDIIMEYFSKKNSRGFEYAYMYPGMNKVLQASGRVIRSEDDKGIVLLIDERFSSKKYTDLFPEEWEHSIRAGNPESLGERVKEFWK